MEQKVAFIGAGSMAEAIISGIIKKGFIHPENIHVTNKGNEERLERLKTLYKVSCFRDKKEVLNGTNVIILAVKPKDVAEALTSFRPFIRSDHRLISVVAGVSTDFISQVMMKPIPVVRAMPNTSAAIGLSATAMAAGRYASHEDLDWARTLFETIGTVVTVEENDLHAVTGLSGSGPAYIYYLVESLEKAAKELGLKKGTARELIVQTLAGTAEMLKSSKTDASELRKQVTSPKGTTQAGLEVLQKYQYQEALIACVRRAAERSMELGETFTSQQTNR
ncbi:MAG: pyrroline-5-carboxylate reductase [Tuberibacillus sp.]